MIKRQRGKWTLTQAHPGAAIHICNVDGTELPALIGKLTESIEGEELDRLIIAAGKK